MQKNDNVGDVVGVCLWPSVISFFTLMNICINDEMHDLNPLGPKLPSKYLSERTLTKLSYCKVQVSCAPHQS